MSVFSLNSLNSVCIVFSWIQRLEFHKIPTSEDFYRTRGLLEVAYCLARYIFLCDLGMCISSFNVWRIWISSWPVLSRGLGLFPCCQILVPMCIISAVLLYHYCVLPLTPFPMKKAVIFKALFWEVPIHQTKYN